ncbi:MAG: hypothetical protein LM591_01695 [Candidatus Korarchaeum sp.]|nr:hypothetical protein [Candidatus Korarchaeum sp.]
MRVRDSGICFELDDVDEILKKLYGAVNLLVRAKEIAPDEVYWLIYEAEGLISSAYTMIKVKLPPELWLSESIRVD